MEASEVAERLQKLVADDTEYPFEYSSVEAGHEESAFFVADTVRGRFLICVAKVSE